MRKYIDFEELESLVQKEIDECITGLSGVDDKLASRINHTVFGASRVLTIAKNMPSIEIVRCKDCKFYHNELANSPKRGTYLCERLRAYTEKEDFCCWGKTK